MSELGSLEAEVFSPGQSLVSFGQSDRRGGQRRVICAELDLLRQEGLRVEIP